MSVLVIAAHPDDETLGCGGTIARLSAEKEPVHILILGEGIRSRSEKDDGSETGRIDALQTHAQKAAGILNAADIAFESFPDNRFDSVPLLDIVKCIEHHIEMHRPHTLFTHFGGDLNIDHSVTFRAALTAARPMTGTSIKNIFAFETLSATDWAFDRINSGFSPTYFVNIEDHIEQKIKAMQAYTGEIRTFPHPRSEEAIDALARYRGSTAGFNFCEAFCTIRQLNP